jgi:hypothetical protein
MLPKQTELASNPLLNKQTNQANQKKEKKKAIFLLSGLVIYEVKSCNKFFFFSFLFYKFRQSLHLLELSIGPPTNFFQHTRVATAAAVAATTTTTRIALFLGTKNYDREKRRPRTESGARADKKGTKSMRETGVNKRQYG